MLCNKEHGIRGQPPSSSVAATDDLQPCGPHRRRRQLRLRKRWHPRLHRKCLIDSLLDQTTRELETDC